MRDGDSRLNAVHRLHDHISDQLVERREAGEVQCAFAAVGCNGIKTADVENHHESVGDWAVIIDHQNFWLTVVHQGPSPLCQKLDFQMVGPPCPKWSHRPGSQTLRGQWLAMRNLR